MSVYIVTGKLGNGKTLAAVGRIRDGLQEGKRVATNLDIYPHEMLHRNSKARITRLPDKPRAIDLQNLGTGDDKGLDYYNESEFGILVLDELASWLNSRTWNDKERQAFIEWLLHARKYHWDVYLIIQDVNAIDKQVRDMFCEHLVICRRLDKLALPFIGGLIKLVTGKMPRMPKLHVASVYYGDNSQAIRADRWVYRGTDLYSSYRTGQQFTQDLLFTEEGEQVDMRASYTVLSPYYTHGRYYVPETIMQILARILNPIINKIFRPILILEKRRMRLRSVRLRRLPNMRSKAYINGNQQNIITLNSHNASQDNSSDHVLTKLADRR